MQPGKAGPVYLIPYTREGYPALAKMLELYPSQPRAARKGLVLTRHPVTKAEIALVDRRQSQDLLPPQEQWVKDPQLKAIGANPGEACNGACQRAGLRCEQRQLEYVNTCEALKRTFACEEGCGHQVGKEIPCYVHDSTRDTARQCLMTDEATPTCEAAHASTTRLCACVPR